MKKYFEKFEDLEEKEEQKLVLVENKPAYETFLDSLEFAPKYLVHSLEELIELNREIARMPIKIKIPDIYKGEDPGVSDVMVCYDPGDPANIQINVDLWGILSAPKKDDGYPDFTSLMRQILVPTRDDVTLTEDGEGILRARYLDESSGDERIVDFKFGNTI